MTEVIRTIPLSFDSKQQQTINDCSTMTKRCSPNASSTFRNASFGKLLSLQKSGAYNRVLETCKLLSQKPGVHSTITMNSAGFYYTGKQDTVRCHTCDLEVSGWTLGMKPFTIHAQRSPTCVFVRSMRPNEIITLSTTTKFHTIISATNDDKKPSKRQKIEVTQELGQSKILTEIDKLKQIRKRTFSHWLHRTSPPSSQMIEAGFFSCNVEDRVICLYCNIICQQWIPNTDDPCEVHKTLSPKCPFVIAMAKRQKTGSIRIVNEQPMRDNSTASSSNDPFRCDEIVYTAACHPAYIEIPKRHASFTAWPNENLPAVDDLVRAGFFYTGTKTIVTCFYCNGSLQDMHFHSIPTIEHVRWFSRCAYAKQLCSAEMYRNLRKSEEIQRERDKAHALSRGYGSYDNTAKCRQQLDIGDKALFTKHVAQRLDLSIVKSLLNRNFELSIIKRCLEDQLRLKLDDFVDDCDLLVACIIVQKQIEHIDGKEEDFIVPSVAMNKIHGRELADTTAYHVSGNDDSRCQSSLATFLNENSSTADDLTQNDGFCTDFRRTMTCSDENEPLEDQGTYDSRRDEYTQRPPYYAYSRQRYGAEQHRKIQELKRVQQERAKSNEPNSDLETSDRRGSERHLNIPDESTLSRFVAARLDLPMTCISRQENIIDSSISTSYMSEKEPTAVATKEQGVFISSHTNSSSKSNTHISTSSKPIRGATRTVVSSVVDQETNNLPSASSDNASRSHTEDSLPSNPCILCLAEKRTLACIPCGHLSTCVACSYSLRSCPVCHHGIDAFVRIYL